MLLNAGETEFGCCFPKHYLKAFVSTPGTGFRCPCVTPPAARAWHLLYSPVTFSSPSHLWPHTPGSSGAALFRDRAPATDFCHLWPSSMPEYFSCGAVDTPGCWCLFCAGLCTARLLQHACPYSLNASNTSPVMTRKMCPDSQTTPAGLAKSPPVENC